MLSFSRFSVRYKLLTILLLSVVGALLLSGVWLSIYVEDYETEFKHREFDNVFLDISNNIISTKSQLSTQIEQFVLDEELVASLHIIAKYQDVENYQPLIFDQEKIKTLDKIHWFMATANASSIRLYDTKMNLVSFYQNSGAEQGFVSFNKSKPIIKASYDFGGAWGEVDGRKYEHLLRYEISGATSQTLYRFGDANEIIVEHIAPVVRTLFNNKRELVGYVVSSARMKFDDLFYSSTELRFDIYNKEDIEKKFASVSQAELQAFAPDIFSRIDAYNQSHTYVNDERLFAFRLFSLSDTDFKYLAVSVDYGLITQRIRNIQYVLGLLLVISALLVIPLALYISRMYFSRPIEQLVDVANSIKTGDYNRKIEIDTEDEFKLLASAFQDAFQVIDKREKSYIDLHSQLEGKVEARTLSLKREIVEKQKAEKLLLYSKAILQMVINSIPQYIFWKDVAGRYMGCNSRYANYVGYEHSDELENKTDAELNLKIPDVLDRNKLEQEVVSNRHPVLHDMRVIDSPDGSRTYFEANIIPLRESEDKLLGILGTYEDVTQRINFENKLIEAKETSEEASRSKSEFLSRMSHELRTPMNAILGFAQLLQLESEIIENSEYKDWVDEIMSAGNHLLELINEVLDLSSIESGKEQLECTSVFLNEIVDKAISIVTPLTNSNNVTINNYIEFDAYIDANELKLKQVLLNLLSNAIKYNKPSGQVDIHAVPEFDKLKIIIRDTGPGIEQDNISKLFSPFERLDKIYSGIEGTGIGLTVCKRFIEAMGGEIGVDSVIGQGSSFWFTLPLTKD